MVYGWDGWTSEFFMGCLGFTMVKTPWFGASGDRGKLRIAKINASDMAWAAWAVLGPMVDFWPESGPLKPTEPTGISEQRRISMPEGTQFLRKVGEVEKCQKPKDGDV